MIYEIDGKIYLKIGDYYKRAEIKFGEVKLVKNSEKLYYYEIKNAKVNQYTVKEYMEKKQKDKKNSEKQFDKKTDFYK